MKEKGKKIMDRWVYSDVPTEVKGDADALVCAVNVEKRYIFCCQIKYLAKMFAYVDERNVALEKGIKPPPEFNLVDDVQFMDIIAELKPDMWKRVAHDGYCTDYECTYSVGITKENFAECCKLYNRHKNLWCELDGAEKPQKCGKSAHEYLLPKDKLRKVIEDNEMLSPDIGSCEAGFPALRQYWELLSPEDQKLDVDSLVNHFDDDLKHIGAEIFRKNKWLKT